MPALSQLAVGAGFGPDQGCTCEPRPPLAVSSPPLQKDGVWSLALFFPNPRPGAPPTPPDPGPAPGADLLPALPVCPVYALNWRPGHPSPDREDLGAGGDKTTEGHPTPMTQTDQRGRSGPVSAHHRLGFSSALRPCVAFNNALVLASLFFLLFCFVFGFLQYWGWNLGPQTF